MFRIRYYSEVIHPDVFRGGLLGWTIRALNWVRWKLETFTQRLVLRFMARTSALPAKRVREIERTFDLDVAAEKLERQRTSPLHAVQVPTDVLRAERYTEGRQATAVEGAVSQEQTGDVSYRPVRLDNLIAQHDPTVRSHRYAKGKRFTVVDEEGDFLPLDEVTDDGRPGVTDTGSGVLRGRRSGDDSRSGVGSGAQGPVVQGRTGEVA